MLASLRWPRLNPRRVDVGFVVDVVELGQVFLWYFCSTVLVSSELSLMLITSSDTDAV
jgi:hypothetical protein